MASCGHVRPLWLAHATLERERVGSMERFGLVACIEEQLEREIGAEMLPEDGGLPLVGDRETAIKGLTILMTGPQLLAFVNMQQLMIQAEFSSTDSTTLRVERGLTHPMLARRIHCLSKHAIIGAASVVHRQQVSA